MADPNSELDLDSRILLAADDLESNIRARWRDGADVLRTANWFAGLILEGVDSLTSTLGSTHWEVVPEAIREFQIQTEVSESLQVALARRHSSTTAEMATVASNSCR